MTNTIERPAWATEAITEDAGKPDEWHRYQRQLSPVATYSDPGSTDEYPATFRLAYDDVDRVQFVAVDGEDFAFHSPEQARTFALALESAADEWERVIGHGVRAAMSRKGVSTAELSRATGIPDSRLALVAENAQELSLAELARIATALDVPPSNLLAV